MQANAEFTTSSLTKKFAPNTTATELKIHFNDLVYLEGKHIMSDGIKPADLLKLKERAESLTGWFNITDAWLDTSEDSACAVVGHISDEGALYPVAIVDCDQYDAPSDSIKLAKFYASANPKAILELISAYEALQKENAELKSEVKEWLCLDCNTVFPSESIPNSFSCLICPKCDGKRMPKNAAIIKVLQAENAAQAKRIAELESELVEWNEFKKIRDMQMQALRKQMS